MTRPYVIHIEDKAIVLNLRMTFAGVLDWWQDRRFSMRRTVLYCTRLGGVLSDARDDADEEIVSRQQGRNGDRAITGT